MSKNSWTLGSFGVVVLLYFLYGWVIVPLVVPSRTLATSTGGRGGPQPPFDTTARDEYADLFPEGAWERTSPKLMQFGRTVVLFQSRDDSIKDVIKISPCTIIHLPDDGDDDSEVTNSDRLRKSIVMQTSEYALLEFSGSLDLESASQLRIKQGQLFGKIVISSGGESPLPDDDLHITCRGVTLTESPGVTIIRSPSEVDFTIGRSRGRGTMLTIEFATDPKKNNSSKELSKVEFQTLQFLDLVTDTIPTKITKTTNGAESSDAEPVASVVAVRCRGMFRFIPDIHQPGHWLAEFNDDVRVDRARGEGTAPDRIECQSLRVDFAPRSDATDNNTSNSLGGLASLALAKVIAVGQPAVLSAPSFDNIVAKADRLSYDLVNKSIALEPRDANTATTPVSLDVRGGDTTVSGRSIHYVADDQGELARLTVSGVGTLRQTIRRDGAPSVLRLSWQKQLVVVPTRDDTSLLEVSVEDRVQWDWESFGQMRADGIQLYCRRGEKQSSDATGDLGNIKPAWARAWGNIQLASVWGTCLLKRLEVYFSAASAGESLASRSLPEELQRESPSAQRFPVRQVQHVQNAQPAVVQPAVIQPSVASLVPLSRLPIDGGTPFDVVSEQMKMLIPLDKTKDTSEPVHVDQVWLAGNVRVTERITAALGASADSAIQITGREVHMWSPATASMEIRLTGEPQQMAMFRGRGVTMMTTNLAVSRPYNTVWSEGIGRLTAAASATSLIASSGTSTNTAAVTTVTPADSPLVIDWNRGMKFNGREVVFEGETGSDTTSPGVRVVYQYHQIDARQLVVRLASLFSFFDKADAPPKAESLACSGDVFVQSIQRAGATITSRERARFGKEVTLNFHIPSGQITANGYGRLQSTFRGRQLALPTLSEAKASPALTEGANGLGCVDVTFHDSLEGNLYQRSVVLLGQVDARYSPVETWDSLLDTNDPSAFVQKGLLLTCGRLHVAVITSPSGASELELRAEDKATIEGRGGQYTGTAESIQYSQPKDLLVMSGNGLANALLWQSDRPGDVPQKIELKRIEYHPMANTVRVSGFHHGTLLAPNLAP